MNHVNDMTLAANQTSTCVSSCVLTLFILPTYLPTYIPAIPVAQIYFIKRVTRVTSVLAGTHDTFVSERGFWRLCHVPEKE